jgi:hypothetical protein
VFSRAYINFKSSEDLFDFKDKFHGHVFVSNKGNQYVCTVEYAPSQKVPKPVEKKDPRDGTIERGVRARDPARQLPTARAICSAFDPVPTVCLGIALCWADLGAAAAACAGRRASSAPAISRADALTRAQTPTTSPSSSSWRRARSCCPAQQRSWRSARPRRAWQVCGGPAAPPGLPSLSRSPLCRLRRAGTRSYRSVCVRLAWPVLHVHLPSLAPAEHARPPGLCPCCRRRR